MKIGLAGSVFVALLTAATPDRRLVPQDVFNLEYTSDPQISPDGRQVVYVRHFADIMTDRNYSNLWIVDFNGSNQRPLTTGNYSDSSPRWSPDGSRLAYISDRGGSPQVWVRWLDSGQTAKLTSLQEAPATINWSPDGKWLSFHALVPVAAPKIAEVPAAPKGATWAAPPVIIDKLIYRFNDAGYLKPGYHHIFVIPSDGGTPRQISSGNFNHGGV